MNIKFSDNYLVVTSKKETDKDLTILKNMKDDFAVRLYCTQDNLNHFKIYSSQEYNLSDIIPVLENMGFKVINQTTYIANLEDKTIYMQDYALSDEDGMCIINLDKNHISKIEEGLKCILHKHVIDDELHKLLNTSCLDVYQIRLLRSLIAYTQQVGTKYSLSAIRKIYAANKELSEMLFASFDAKFNPEFSKEQSTEKFVVLEQDYSHKLQNVKSLDEEIVLGNAFKLIKAMLRTNYYAVDKINDGLAYKFESKNVPNLPKPHPMFEIFVYHKDTHGIHLRGGKIARGGLRWSDRKADFRSEVLGLVKTQITKNSIIIPTGSKGGFVVRKNTDGLSKKEYLETGIECYKIFINGLLSITDNIIKGKIITPDNVVRYDEQDPYLVVAADKGTATFSDIANSLAIKHGFWLKDAFASGGENGYDHKKMGITAKGGWESVKRHFRHLDMDIQNQDFTVMAIGGMSGDVFGNGMLLSKKINLVASFNHNFIFVDPNPNVEKSYKERQRLFAEVKSWEDYNQSLISKGGGVFSRSAKSIKISSEMKERFAITENELTPDELIVKLMKSSVDLIWNGGIGTFVKSSLEDNSDVPDRANDNIRVNGKDIKAKVIGEGGNLGFTQLGRIEYNNNGGKIYTDAIDNSAGVSCSDKEVNIKILLESAIENGSLEKANRNSLLQAMTQDVENKVLEDNYNQGSLLDVEESLACLNVNYYKDLMDNLEHKGLLDRKVETLPSNLELDERLHLKNKVISSPELSVLLAYAKIDLASKLINSSLVKAPSSERFLFDYFPLSLHKYKAEIKKHKLRDDIIATQISNYIINKMGLSFVVKMQSQSVSNVEDIVRSFLITEQVFNLSDVYSAVYSLDNKVNASVQVGLIARLQKVVESQSLWCLKNLEKPLHIVNSVKLLTDILSSTKTSFDFDLDSATVEKIEKTLASFEALQAVLDSGLLAHKLNKDFAVVKSLFDEISDKMSVVDLEKGIKAVKTKTAWDEIASQEFINEIYSLRSNLAQRIIESGCSLSDYLTNKHIVLKDFKAKVKSIELVNFNYSIVKVLISRLSSILG